MANHEDIKFDKRNKSILLVRILSILVILMLMTSICSALANDLERGINYPPVQSAPAPQGITLQQFGALLLKNAPPEIQNGDNLAKARYAYAAYMNMLAQNGVQVNWNLGNRLGALLKSGNAGLYNCGDHSGNLNQIFDGIGIPNNQRFEVGVSMPLNPQALAQLGINANHGATAVVSNRNAAVFDAWSDGLESTQEGRVPYSQPTTGLSPWNGMDFDLWASTMEQNGYTQITDFDTTSPISYPYSILSNHVPRVPPQPANDQHYNAQDVLGPQSPPGIIVGNSPSNSPLQSDTVYSQESSFLSPSSDLNGWGGGPKSYYVTPGQANPSGQTYTCPCCGATFTDKAAYDAHVNQCCN